MKIRKLGGYASILLVLVGFAMASILAKIFPGFTGLDIYDPAKMMAAYQNAATYFYAYYVLGMLDGILTLLIVLALRERMQAKAPNMMLIATIAASAFAVLSVTGMIAGFFRNILLIRMHDMSTFRSFLVIHEYIFSAAASTLGWSFLMIGCAAIKTRELPRILSCLIIPFSTLMIIEFVFTVFQFQPGLNIISFLWVIVFVWLGIEFLREH